MSEAALAKDARGILNAAGPEALRAAVMTAEPVEAPEATPPPQAKPEGFPITRVGLTAGMAVVADFVGITPHGRRGKRDLRPEQLRKIILDSRPRRLRGDWRGFSR